MRRPKLTERSELRIADLVDELVAEAEKRAPDVRRLQSLAARCFDLGGEVASIQLRAIAAERELAAARVAALEAALADRDHTIEALRLRSR